MSFFDSIGSEIKKTAATKIAGAVVGTATLAATGATISYFAKSPSSPSGDPAPQAQVASAQDGTPASAPETPSTPSMPKMTPPPAGSAPQTAVVGGVTVEFQPDYGTAAASDSKDAADQAKDFVASKKWKVGANENGMIVGIGQAVLPCASDSNSFDQCRRQAFSEAMFQARKELVKFLSAKVSASVESLYREGDIVKELAKARAGQVAEQPGLVQKVALLASSYIDEELKSRGVDFGQQQAAQADADRQNQIALARKEAEELVTTSEFKSAVEALAASEVSGIQAYRTFEFIPAGGKGSIAVVAVQSDRSSQLQRALLGLGEAPTGAPKEPISQWAAAQGAGNLLYTFGCQPRINESGELVLVAFGQSSPIGNTERQVDAAEKKAALNAQREARLFLGAAVMSQEQQIEAATLKEFADDTAVYQSQSRYEERLSARADRLDMPGGLRAFRWKMKHPLSPKVTVGVVYEFSVTQALQANKLRDAFKAAGGAAGGAGISTKRPTEAPAPKKPEQKRPLSGGSGVGAEGDEP